MGTGSSHMRLAVSLPASFSEGQGRVKEQRPLRAEWPKERWLGGLGFVEGRSLGHLLGQDGREGRKYKVCW